MKHAYVVQFYHDGLSYFMPYLFTSEKEAYLYGEYAWRVRGQKYRVVRIDKLSRRFYALK